ncbi:adenosylcobinamide-phosphate synthase CbiB [Mycoplasmatota bacterium WC44]
MIIVLAVFLDLMIGDPLWFPHPIIYIGKIISFYERKLYHKDKKFFGFLMVLLTLITVYGIFEIILFLSSMINIEDYVVVFFLFTSLATNSLAKAAKEVYKSGSLKEARIKLSYIVGRETATLNEQEIIRGTIETVAENTIDGVIAPLFYMIIGQAFGIPVQAVFLYKTINTLDSMIGYKNDKYSSFGYFAAKIDDLANYIPARIGSFIMLIAGLVLKLDFIYGIKVFFKDRYKHKSPNAGHPESVVAGLLNIKLGGPNVYFGEAVNKPWIGNNDRILRREDIIKTNHILYVSALLITLTLIIIEVIR